MKAFCQTKTAVLSECVALMILLQGLRIGAEKWITLGLPGLSGKMATMCAMILLWLLFVSYIYIRRVSVPVFPKSFTRFYILITIIAACLFIATPSNYVVGWTAILELFYGSIVTPVFEETIFRGYMWTRLRTVYQSERIIFLFTALMFALWHIGYMIPQLLCGNWFAVGTKLAAGLIYGLILGAVRWKCGNCYLPAVVHGVMNLFMI